MRKSTTFFGLFLAVILTLDASAADRKKVLFVDSYHEGYPWSDGITAGVTEVVGDQAELKVVRMDTKRNTGEGFKTAAAVKIKETIDTWQPDVVIVADDNASKYLVVPHYKDAAVPFVFCGVNWDSSTYGFPCSNVCGMEEVALVEQLLAELRRFAKGDRIGYLACDNLTNHKEAENFKAKFGIQLDEVYVKTFDEWQTGLKDVQGRTDMVIIDSTAGIEGWDDDAARAFCVANTTVPTGGLYDFVAPLVLVSYAKVSREQGQWAAASALKILAGEKPAAIGVTQNKRGEVFINMPIAKKLGVRFPMSLIEQAQVIK